MTVISLNKLILRMVLWKRDISPFQLLVCLLWGVGICVWFWWVPHLKHQRVDDQNQCQQLQARLDHWPVRMDKEVLSLSEQHLHDFYASLGETHYAEEQVSTLISLANKNGLIMGQTDYKLAENKNGNFQTYIVNVPIKGQYAAIRHFCDQVLLAIPFASLDELNFKRAAISNPIIETRVRFTLFLYDEQGSEGRTFVLPHIQGKTE